MLCLLRRTVVVSSHPPRFNGAPPLQRLQQPITVMMMRRHSNNHSEEGGELVVANQQQEQEGEGSDVTTNLAYTEKPVPIHILGGGSIGLLFAASVRSVFPSYPIGVLLREKHLPKIDNDTNHIMVCLMQKPKPKPKSSKPQQPKRRMMQPRMVPVPAQIIGDPKHNKRRPIQNLIVSTKAYSATEAVRSVLDRLTPQPQSQQHVDDDGFCAAADVSEKKDKNTGAIATSSIIVLCNGAFAVKDQLLHLLNQSSMQDHVQLILATTTHGAYQEKTNDGGDDDDDDMYRVVHAGQGKTFLEEDSTATTTEPLSQFLDQSGLSCKAISTTDMEILLWQKLAANCTINPLTALYGCENGEIVEYNNNNNNKSDNDNNIPSLEDILQEVSKVAIATMTTNNNNTSEPQLHQRMVEYESLRQFVFQVIEDTYHNRSSMLQDVTNQQRTEVEYLNGYIVQKGEELGIETPANKILCQRIQELSSNRNSNRRQ